MAETILSKIFFLAQIQPQKTAIVCKSEKVSYRLLACKIRDYASFLYTKGVSRDDVILLSGENKLAFIYSYFAVHLLGGVNVVIDAHSNPERLQYIIKATHPKLMLGGLNEEGVISYTAIEQDVPLVAIPEKPSSPKDICDILFTTGTTAAPKGVCLSHSNELAATKNICEFIGNDSTDIELIALPLCHSFGLGRLRCSLYVGATVVILNGFTNVKNFFTTIEAQHITGFGMVPAAWNYLRRVSGEKLGKYKEQLKYIEIGSASMPVEDKRLLSALLPKTKICMHYGLTEASRSTFCEFHADKSHLESIGKPSPNVEIKVKDADGLDVPDSVEGEICVKGAHVMERYLLDTDNRSAWHNEYFRTGDWGIRTPDGFFYLKGRGKELINVGGKKLSPEEVEKEIMQIGWFADCACVGIPDPKGMLGDVVKCFAVKKASEDTTVTISQLSDALQGKLETYKIPVLLEFIDKIPTTESGKKQRLQLKYDEQ